MKYLILFLILIFPVAGMAVSADSLKYVDAATLPLIGKGFEDTQNRYDRLPAQLENITRPPVWNLSKNCSGLAIRFRTNSTVIGAEWEVTNDAFMNHFTMTGIKGLDLYCLENGEWQFVNTARPSAKVSKVVIIQNMPEQEKEYMLYLPLYDGLESIEIGVAENAEILPPEINSPKKGKPVVFYGTSITQGGCASRAGMAYPNILSRMLDREIVNLGFSGNGKLDLEVAEAMAAIDASCFVIDCLPNVTTELMNEKYVRFYETIRKKNQEVPIIMIENILYPYMYFDQNVHKLILEKNETLKQIFKEQKAKGDKNVFYVKADDLIGDSQEATVDGVHLTDLGFMNIARELYPVLKKRIE
ncbi:SGNH/GDSL hydrolase family protein [Maribellus maritimus]|uniref:SGNH/GDSL hydrolase family protein n=1 Tax=Maribellus maritimus TaxID=2870838 RepID=UPI001EEB0ABD|nr:SGNH/GDSL hydrolase family protein [Maribellus maritimus]MCG6185779.1 SGNH/GDSL hydrolase family protein [Maribellus maritimus]